jgi:hypothetical protein
MMSDVVRVARFYWLLLAVFTLGRWVMRLRDVPYEKGHHVFSIVILTFLASAFFAAFCRAWRGYGLKQAALLGAVFGLSAQVVIFTSTVASYGLGLETYFNHPRALQAEVRITLAQALQVRAPALAVGTAIQVIVALVGWTLGGLLPREKPAA